MSRPTSLSAVPILLCLTLALALQGPASGSVLTVSPDGSGPYPTISAAVGAAASGDTVRLLPGVFHGAGNRGVHLNRPITMLSAGGDPTACIMDAELAENTLLSVFSGSVNLQGITFRNSLYYGVWVDQSVIASGSISDCVFTGNVHAGYQGDGYSGYNECVFTDCSFTSNGSFGAAFGANGQPHFTNCTFAGNHTGASFGYNFTDVLFTGCTFRQNSSASDGGGIACGQDVLTIDHCLFYQNSAVNGGAFYGGYPGAVLFRSCTLLNNSSSGDGSSIYLESGFDLEVRSSILAFGQGGDAVGGTAGEHYLACCDVYGNQGGDYAGPISDQGSNPLNINRDPLICNAGGGDFGLQDLSPCAPGQSPGFCGLIGAFPVDCQSAGVSPTAGIPGLRVVGPIPNPGHGSVQVYVDGAGGQASGTLDILDAAGRRIFGANLRFASGSGAGTWNGRTSDGLAVPAGVYFFRIHAGGTVVQRSLVWLR